MTSPNTLHEGLAGSRDTFPLIFAAMPFGIVFGALAQAQGLEAWLTMAISMFVFAGASQFVAVTLLAAGASIPVIVLTVFVVNLRHTLYAVTLVPLVKHFGLGKRTLMAFSLTDETFAVVLRRSMQSDTSGITPAYYAGSAGLMYVNWVLCTAIGIVAGDQMPQLTEFGLDIAMVVAFVGIVVPQLTLASHWLCAFTAGVLGILTFDWPHQSGLLVSAFAAIAVGVMSEYAMALKNGASQEVESNE